MELAGEAVLCRMPGICSWMESQCQAAQQEALKHTWLGGEDESVLWQPKSTHLYNYSIAFQPSYSVPILLFSGRNLGK